MQKTLSVQNLETHFEGRDVTENLKREFKILYQDMSISIMKGVLIFCALSEVQTARFQNVTHPFTKKENITLPEIYRSFSLKKILVSSYPLKTDIICLNVFLSIV